MSLRRAVAACLPQQDMLQPDDRDRSQDLAPGDHRWRLVSRHPADFGRFVIFWLAYVLGSVREEQILRIVKPRHAASVPQHQAVLHDGPH